MGKNERFSIDLYANVDAIQRKLTNAQQLKSTEYLFYLWANQITPFTSIVCDLHISKKFIIHPF